MLFFYVNEVTTTRCESVLMNPYECSGKISDSFYLTVTISPAFAYCKLLMTLC